MAPGSKTSSLLLGLALLVGGSWAEEAPADRSEVAIPDVPATCPVRAVVHALCRAGIMTTFPDGRFRGNALVTRSELAAASVRALRKFGEDLDEDGSPRLTGRIEDVPEQDPDRQLIEAAVTTGIMETFEERFAPAESVNRHGLARALLWVRDARLGVARPPADSSGFRDERHFFDRDASAEEIAEVVRLGILQPYYGDDFKGGNRVTRYALAEALNALIDSMERDPPR